MNNRNHVLSTMLNYSYPVIERGEGIYLIDEKGNKIIDSAGGPLLCSLGFGNREFGEVIRDQTEKLNFAYRMHSTTRILEKAAEEISKRSDGAIDRIFFVSGGSEAVEAAVKIARTYEVERGKPQKHKIISRWLSFHGSTNGALSLSGHVARRAMFEPMLKQGYHIPAPYCYRCPYNMKEGSCDFSCAKALETEILMQRPETVSAFIIEPLSGSSLAAVHPAKEYYRIIREICNKYDVLLIFDEVMTGMGRTGKWFAYQHFDVKPDIIALGKAISGGFYPAGAACCSAKVAEAIIKGSGIFPMGHTWAGNPVASAVIVKNLEYMEEHKLLERINQNSAILMQGLKDLAKEEHLIGDIRGKGLMIGLELVKNRETKEPLDPKMHFAFLLSEETIKNGMFTHTISPCVPFASDMVLFGPPFITTEKEIETILGIFKKSLTSLKKKLGL